MPEQHELLAASMQTENNLNPDAPPATVVSHAVVEGEGNIAMENEDDDFGGNENNKRVHARMTAEKERLQKSLTDKPTSFHRAGSVLNPGDLSAGGMGGELGDNPALSSSGDAAEQVAQASAWGVTNAAIQAIKDKTPKGKAKAAGDGLLGDDKPAPAPGWQAPPSEPPAQ